MDFMFMFFLRSLAAIFSRSAFKQMFLQTASAIWNWMPAGIKIANCDLNERGGRDSAKRVATTIPLLTRQGSSGVDSKTRGGFNAKAKVQI